MAVAPEPLLRYAIEKIQAMSEEELLHFLFAKVINLNVQELSELKRLLEKAELVPRATLAEQ